jgi:hypothetical protein
MTSAGHGQQVDLLIGGATVVTVAVASKSSSISSRRIGVTIALRLSRSCTSPSATRSFSASRDGVRDTPRASQRSVDELLARLRRR